jgi:DNA replication protein DnaC
MISQPKSIGEVLPFKVDEPKIEAKWKAEEARRLEDSKRITPKLLSEFERLACIPKDFHGTGFNNFDVDFNHQKRVLKKTVEFAKRGKWVIFSGKMNGIGKTRLAVDSLKYAYLFGGRVDWQNIYQRGYPEHYRFYSVRRLIMALQTAGITQASLFNSVINRKGLILDEMGGEDEVRDGFQSRVVLEEIVSGAYDSRYNKILLITTPLTKSEFFDRYDGRIIDRLGKRSAIIELTGKSYRLK